MPTKAAGKNAVREGSGAGRAAASGSMVLRTRKKPEPKAPSEKGGYGKEWSGPKAPKRKKKAPVANKGVPPFLLYRRGAPGAGDIGEWGEHEQAPPSPPPRTSNSQTPNQAVGTRFLKGSEASPDDVGTILRGLGVAKFRMFETCSDAGLDAPARLALMRHADSQQPAAEADFKLGLSRVELVSLVGEKAALSLELTFRRFGGDAYRSASLPPFFSTPPTTRSELFTPFRE